MSPLSDSFDSSASYTFASCRHLAHDTLCRPRRGSIWPGLSERLWPYGKPSRSTRAAGRGALQAGQPGQLKIWCADALAPCLTAQSGVTAKRSLRPALLPRRLAFLPYGASRSPAQPFLPCHFARCQMACAQIKVRCRLLCPSAYSHFLTTSNPEYPHTQERG